MRACSLRRFQVYINEKFVRNCTTKSKQALSIYEAEPAM